MRFVLLLPLMALVGCSSFSSDETLVVQPHPQWVRGNPGTSAEYRPPARSFRPDALPDAPINSVPTKTADSRTFSMSSLITARTEIAQVAADRTLAPRLPTKQEQRGGWTEVYEGASGLIAVKENDLGTRLEIRIKDNGKQKPPLRYALEQKLGPLLKPTSK